MVLTAYFKLLTGPLLSFREISWQDRKIKKLESLVVEICRLPDRHRHRKGLTRSSNENRGKPGEGMSRL